MSTPSCGSPGQVPPNSYDAFLMLAFGAPEGSDQVVPFLENVTRGKNVPKQRILQVAKHYELFDGVSPANAQFRALIAAVLKQFNSLELKLSVYWGNRNWHPLIEDTLRQMADDGITRAMAWVASPLESPASHGQYLEELRQARAAVGPKAPEVDVLPVFFDKPGFIRATASRVLSALEKVPEERRPAARVVYTAHSLPVPMADECPYRQQFEQACRLVSRQVGLDRWEMAYQSRSGPPSQAWLEPDIGHLLRQLAEDGKVRDAIVVPISFVYEHMETVYDLDKELGDLCQQLKINMIRAATVGCHASFVEMIGQMAAEYQASKY
jgi:ferrochelatase